MEAALRGIIWTRRQTRGVVGTEDDDIVGMEVGTEPVREDTKYHVIGSGYWTKGS